MAHQLSEDARIVLRRIVEAQAYRQLMAMNIRGHCLKFFTDVESKVRVAEQLHLNLTILREVSSLYRELGWEDVESAVRDRMARIPYPESRLEFGVFRHLCGVALEIAMRSYVDGAEKRFGAIARSFLDRHDSDLEDPEFIEFCSDPSHRPHAQQMFNRWFSIAVRSLGRPGTPGDARAVELGLRTQTASEWLEEYVAAIQTVAERCGLEMPDAAEFGLELEATGS